MSRGLDAGISADKIDKWFAGTAQLTPRLILRTVTGNYSLGNVHIWENQQTASFLWRQHYEEVEANN